jgi:hypothetical protein
MRWACAVPLAPSRPGAALYSEAARRQALRGPDGSMHETVDAMLEEFEKAGAAFDRLPIPCQGLALLLTLASPSPLTTHHSPLTTHHSLLTTHHSPPNLRFYPRPHHHQAGISFQGCLYSFVFCLLVYAWSATKAGSTALCVLSLSAMAIFTVYCMVVRTKEVETTFPLYSIPLVSGAFFNKKAGAGGANGVLDPAASVQAEVQAEAQATDPPAATSTPAAARPPPARVAVPPPRSRGGKHGARAAGTPVLMADRAPALPPAIAARHAEQQRLVAEARVRAVERKAVDKEAGQTRQKDGKWFTRLRDR